MNMLKRGLSFLLTLVMVLSMIPATHAHAAEVTSGYCGDPNVNEGKDVTWTLADGVLTISGTGKTNEYGYMGEMYGVPYGHDHLSTPWTETAVTSLVVEEGVTHILGLLSWGAYNLTDVSLPDSLKVIGHCSFEDCDSLTSITIPKNVTSIWSGAFWACENLTSITFTGDAPSINDYAFNNAVTATCYYPASANWPADKLKSYGGNLTWVPYGECNVHSFGSGDVCTVCGILGGSCGSDLTWTLDDEGNLVITGTGDMRDYDFGTSPFYKHADKITSVSLPDGLTSIGERAFDATFPNLDHIEIPTSVTHIQECAFGATYNKVKLKYPGTMAQWEDLYIAAISSYGKQYGAECSDGTIIYMGPCSGSNGLYDSVKYMLLGDGTLKITGSGAMTFYRYLNYESCFSGDDKITKVVIDEGVTNIAGYAFKNCTNLTEVHIPASVTSISYNVFQGCTALTDVYYGSNEKNWNKMSISSDSNEPLAAATIHYTNLCTAGHDPAKLDYDVSDLTISATCGVCYEAVGSLTLVAPKGMENPTKPYAAKVEGEIPGVTYTLTYCCAGGCTTPGEHNVKLSVTEDVWVDTRFVLESSELTILSVRAKDRVYNGNDYVQITEVTLSDLPEGVDVQVDLTKLNAYLPVYTVGKQTIVSLRDVALTGKDADSYTIRGYFDEVPILDGVNITPAPLTLKAADRRVPLGTRDLSDVAYMEVVSGSVLGNDAVNYIEITGDTSQITTSGVLTIQGAQIVESNSMDDVTYCYDITYLPGVLTVYCEAHEWIPADCITPKTCSICGETEGDVNNSFHHFTYGICDDCGAIQISATTFPDGNFRGYIFSRTYGADGLLTQEELQSVTSIDVNWRGISDLTGIQYFTALKILSCYNNQLTSLDVSKNTALEDLSCYNNQLTSLDVSKNTALENLHCQSNQLTSLNVSGLTALGELYCFSNQLTELDVSGCTALETLYCYSNKLTSLDVSKNTALKTLRCGGNQLTSLNVSKNSALTDLECYSNQLTSLDVSKNTALEDLSCHNNQLTSLDVSKNTALKTLSCHNNQLTSLDVSKNTALETLWCDNNQLTSLDVSKNTALKTFRCGLNQLTSLDLSNCANLGYVNCSGNERTISTTGSKFDLSTLSADGFDISKASNWQGGTVSGNILTATAETVTYTYDLGNGETETFTLVIDGLCSHEWLDATCTAPKTCSVCGETEGEALGHAYESGICSRCDAVHPNLAGYSGKTISILGDSISTFTGVSNDPNASTAIQNNATFYNGSVLGVGLADTWWQQTVDALDLELLVNNSWSGSCIYTTRAGTPGAYVARCEQLHNNEGTVPDVIAIYLGTNDYYNFKSTLGSAGAIDYAQLIRETADGYTYAEPTTAMEAYAIMLHKMTKRYPMAEIYCFTLLPMRNLSAADQLLLEQFNDGIKELADRFDVNVVDLYTDSGIKTDDHFQDYIADNSVHPGPLGMDAITDVFVDELLEQGAPASHTHSYEGVVTPPTCTEQGYTTYICTACGGSYVADRVPAKNHDWQDANCVAPETCINCGQTRGEIDPYGHSFADGTCKHCGILGGQCGDEAYWMFSGGKLTVYGSGSMYDYQGVQVPWGSKRPLITQVEVTGDVTSVGDYAFNACYGLTAVTLADSVVEVGQDAFAFCSNLQTVDLGNGLESFGYYAFRNCTSLKELTIPGSIRNCGESAFQDCTALESVTFDDGAAAVGMYMFQGCTALKSVTLPDSITYLADAAFRNCGSLESITIPAGVKDIGVYAFENCTSLETVQLQEGLERIGGYAFYGCEKLQGVQLPTSVERIDESAFAFCTALTALELPQGLGFIGFNAFDRSGLASITVPGTVTELYGGTFYGCEDLAVVVLEEGVTTLYSGVFRSCTGLHTLVLPKSITQIYDGVLEDTNVADLYYGGSQDAFAPLLSKVSAQYIHYNCTQPEGHWSEVTRPGSCTQDGYTCDSCPCGYERNIRNVQTAPGHDWLDADCETAKTCKVCGATEGEALGHDWDDATCVAPKTCSVCGETEGAPLNHNWLDATCSAPETCSRCGETRGQIMPDNHHYQGTVCIHCGRIGGKWGEHHIWHFDPATGKLTISGTGDLPSMAGINPPWNDYASAITSLELEDGITSVGEQDFFLLTNLQKVELPESVTYIYDHAFSSCYALKELELPEGLLYIGNYAFWSCPQYTTITIPEKVAFIGDEAFWCESNAHITFEGPAPQFGASAFKNVTGTAVYPIDEPTWTEDARQNYGGAVTWLADCCLNGHAWTPADCENAKTCSRCGETEGEALGHDWVDADCVNPKTCKVCGETEGVALGHDWVDADCVNPKTCKVCGETEGEALGHDWVDADCVNPKTCSVCGETEGVALGHDWVDANCTAPKTCIRCNETEGEALGHTEVTDKAVEATCTATGLTEGKHCSVCGKVTVAQQTVPTKEHETEMTGGILPTCTQEGYTEGYRCRLCGWVEVEPVRIPPTDHTEVTDKAVAATCTTTGLTEGKHCTVCGTVTQPQQIVTAAGHKDNDKNYICDVCGEDLCTDHQEEILPAKAATCTATGLTEGKKCARCGDILVAQQTVPVKAHTEVTDQAVEATCTTTGLTEGKHCSVCGTVTVAQQTVPTKAHVEVPDQAVAATCTAAGKTEGSHCAVCGKVLKEQDKIPAMGHTPVVDAAVEATCSTEGLTAGAHCVVCDQVIKAQETIAKKDHTWKAATCSNPKTCTACGATSGYALGHDWAAGNCTTPKTCKTCGVKDGGVVHAYEHQYDYKCDLCGTERIVDMTRPMVDMFRMYNPNTGEHFYTGSTEERDNLIAVGWQYEGVGFTFPLTTGKPVHRLFQPSTGEHLYTMDEAEKDKLMAEGWNYEGIAFNSGFENEVPQYRLHNPNATVGAYHFTASLEEKNNLLAAGWEYQGIGWYSLGA